MAFTAETTVNPPHYANVEFDYVWRQRRPLRECVPLDPTRTWLPSSGYLEKPRKKRIPDAIGRWEVILVSARFKELLEDLSPDSQQFFPFALRNGPKADAETLEYYVLNVTTMADCVVDKPPGTVISANGQAFDLTERSLGYTGFVSADLTKAYACVIDPSRIPSGHHIWRAPDRHRLFFSNRLVRLAKTSPKLTGFDGCECLEREY